MKTPALRYLPLAVLGVVAVLHTWWQKNLVSLFPLPLLLSTVLVWSAPAPRYALVVLALAGELWGALPPGVISLLVVTPLALRRLYPRLRPGVSFSFVGLLLLTVALQLLLLASPLGEMLLRPSWRTIWGRLPWQLGAMMLLLNTIVAGILSVMLSRLAPHHPTP